VTFQLSCKTVTAAGLLGKTVLLQIQDSGTKHSDQQMKALLHVSQPKPKAHFVIGLSLQ